MTTMSENTIEENRRSGKKKTAVTFIYAVILLDLLGMTVLIPVTPVIVQQYSQKALMVTLMTVLYAGAQFVAAPFLGRLSDRYGRRPVLIACIFGSAIGYFLFGLGGALWVLLLSRLIDGFTGGNLSTAMAYLADVSAPHERARYFGLMGAAFGLAFILGPASGGALGQIHPTAPAFAAGGLSLISGVVGFFVLPESLPLEKRAVGSMRLSEINPFAAIFDLLRRSELVAILLAQSLLNFVTAGFNSLVSVYFLRQFGASPLQIAGVLVAVGVMNILMQAGFIDQLVKRFGERNLAVFGLIFQAIQVAGTVLVPTYWMMYIFQGIASGGAGIVRPSLSALLANRVTQQEQGKLNGVSTSLNSFMGMLGPLAAGLLYDHVSPQAPFLAGGIFLCLAAAWAGLTEKNNSTLRQSAR